MNAPPDPDRFRRLWALGYRRLCPIVPHDANIYAHSSLNRQANPRGKAPGERRYDGTWRGLDFVSYEADESDLDRWAVMGAGVGIKTGPQHDGTHVVAIDADTLNPDQAALIEERIRQRFGDLPKRVGQSPKALFPIRTSAGFAYTRIEFSDGVNSGKPARVEILAAGRQFVTEGIHPITMKPYAWLRPLVQLSDLPIATPDDLLALLEELKGLLPAARIVQSGAAAADVDQSKLRGPIDLVRKAVEALPNTSALFPGREDYLAVGYAIKAALSDDPVTAEGLFTDWCDRWGDDPHGEINDPSTVAADWRRMKPPFRRGAAYLYDLSRRHSGGRFTLGDVWFDDKPPPAEPLFPEPATTTPEVKAILKPLSAFWGEYVPIDYVVEPIIRTGSLYTLTAKTGSGKTALLISTSMAVVTGRKNILGMDVASGRVAFLTFENPDDVRMRMRVTAHRLLIDIGAIGDKLMILDARLKPEIVITALREAALLEPFRLIIVDTLAAWFDGDNANDPVQAGEFLRRLRPMTRLPSLPAVVVAAHPVKNASEDQLIPYGSGAILNEVDGNLTLWRRAEGGAVRLHWQGKLRGLEFEPPEFRFDISSCPDVLDAKGRLVQLPTMVPAEKVDPDVQDATERNLSLAILKAMLVEPESSQRRWAEMAKCGQSLVGKRLLKLKKDRLTEQSLHRWRVTPKGEKEVEKLDHADHRDQTRDHRFKYTNKFKMITVIKERDQTHFDHMITPFPFLGKGGVIKGETARNDDRQIQRWLCENEGRRKRKSRADHSTVATPDPEAETAAATPDH